MPYVYIILTLFRQYLIGLATTLITDILLDLMKNACQHSLAPVAIHQKLIYVG